MNSCGQHSGGSILREILRWGSIGILVIGLLLGLLWGGLMFLLQGPLYFAWPPSFTEVPAERSPLIDKLVSYQSVDEVTAILKQDGYAWTLKESAPSSPPPDAPPLEFVDLRVAGFVHFGHGGLLKLHFLNNRLGSAVFLPLDLPGYLEQLAKHEGLLFEVPRGKGLEATRSSTTIPPYTKVSTTPDWGALGPPGVAWSDTRLTWEERVYSAKYED